MKRETINLGWLKKVEKAKKRKIKQKLKKKKGNLDLREGRKRPRDPRLSDDHQ